MKTTELRKFIAAQANEKHVDLNDLIQNDLVELSILNFDKDVNKWRSDLNLISSQNALYILNQQIQYNANNENYDKVIALSKAVNSVKTDLKQVTSPVYQTNDLPGLLSIDRFKSDVFVNHNFPKAMIYGELNKLLNQYKDVFDKVEQENQNIRVFS